MKKKKTKKSVNKNSRKKINSKSEKQNSENIISAEGNLHSVDGENTKTNSNNIKILEPVVAPNYNEIITKKEEVTLLASTNIFGFQFKKYTSLFIDSKDRLIAKDGMGYCKPIFLDYFDRIAEDFISEAKKSNEIFIEIQKKGELSAYSINFENNTNKPLQCILFGMNAYLLSDNFGSDKGLKVSASQSDVSYLECIQQACHRPFETKMVKIISENFEQLKQPIYITSKDANGQMLQIPVSTISYLSNDINKVLPIVYPMKIDGNTNLGFTVLPKTKGTIEFYVNKNIISKIDDKTMNLYNSILSCQIQQGLNYVSINNFSKFANSQPITENMITTLFKKGMIKFIEENGEKKFGVNFRIVKIDGSILNVDLLTALKKSEIELKNN